jgi:fluoride ion exporter CrcB/FEX
MASPFFLCVFLGPLGSKHRYGFMAMKIKNYTWPPERIVINVLVGCAIGGFSSQSSGPSSRIIHVDKMAWMGCTVNTGFLLSVVHACHWGLMQ